MVSMSAGVDGFNACAVAYGLTEGLPRDERRALRRAERAEHAFRVAKGYASDSLWAKLQERLKQHLNF